MKIVIAGAGGVGYQLASQLIAKEYDVVLIERNAEVAKHVANHLDCIIINDEANRLSVLREAGLESADCFISVTDSDEVNLVTALMAHSEFHVPRKIVRVGNSDYVKSKSFGTSDLGINHLINPEMEAAAAIARTVREGAYSDVYLFKSEAVQMRTLSLTDESPFVALSLQEMRTAHGGDYLVAAIIRDDEVLIPTGHTVLRAGDLLQIVSDKETLEKLFARSGHSVIDKLREVIIVGGGRIGRQVARSIKQRKRHVKIIESSYAKCKQLSEELANVTVIHSDITDESIFDEEQLHNYELIITTTGNQELNMLSAAYAKSLGVKQAIALVHNSNYVRIASRIGIDSTVSPKGSAVDAILSLLTGGKFRSVHTIANGQAEVVEMTLDEQCPVLQSPLKNVSMPENSLILSVIRDNQHHLPDGNFSLQAGDDVIVISLLANSAEIEQLFTGSA